MTVRTFQRAGYEGIGLYSAIEQQCAVDLSDNTNLWGPAPSAIAAIRSSGERIARYPAAYSTSLVRAFSEYLAVPPECIATGCGSDDVLDSAIRAFVEPGGVVAMCDPTFSMIPVFTRLNGAVPVKIPFVESGRLDVEALLSSRARLIYLCSPNNPTGSVVRPEQIEDLLARFDGVVILDAAYAEFSDDPFTAMASTRDNLVVTRTMSKAFGLAGIRVGYSVSSPALAAEISKSRGPYKISSSSESAAVAAIENDIAWMRSCVEEMQANRNSLGQKLESLGFQALASSANFLMIPVANATSVGEKLASLGVGVRAFSDLAGIGDAIRVTIGPEKMMERFVDAFVQAVA